MSEKPDQLLLDALEIERRYTAKELHDGIAQTTLQLGLQIGICRKLLERNNFEMLAGELVQLEDRIHKASGQVRDLIQDLRPPTLPEENAVTLNDFIQYAIDVHIQRSGPPVAYQYRINDSEVRLSGPQLLGLMRIVQEGLLNVRKHAAAQNVRLTVSAEQGNLYMTLADDGKGFDTAEVESRLMNKGGVGLTNLQMRTRAVGGVVTVARDTTGNGTKITVILPI